MIKLIALSLIALSTPGCSDLLYRASFPNGSLACCIAVDNLHNPYKVPLEKGHSETVGSEPKWDPTPLGIKLQVTDPTLTDEVTPSAGIFNDHVKFGLGSRFRLRAKFQNPKGPHSTDHVWAAGAVVARTGDNRDLGEERRLNLSLKVNGSRAYLDVTEPTGRTDRTNVEEPMFLSIFSPQYPRPYTLELIANRRAGKGQAILKVDGHLPLASKEFDLGYFQVGELITTVGATVAIVNSPGSTVSAEVLEFEIFVDPDPIQLRPGN